MAAGGLLAGLCAQAAPSGDRHGSCYHAMRRTTPGNTVSKVTAFLLCARFRICLLASGWEESCFRLVHFLVYGQDLQNLE